MRFDGIVPGTQLCHICCKTCGHMGQECPWPMETPVPSIDACEGTCAARILQVPAAEVADLFAHIFRKDPALGQLVKDTSRRALALAVTTQVSRYGNSSFHILAVRLGCTTASTSVIGAW